MKPEAVGTFSLPKVTAYTSAVTVRGHQMGALRDGWVLIYEHTERPPGADLIDELCVVYTTDGRRLVRYLRPGRKPSSWDLLTVTGAPELDVSLDWASPVTMIVPHAPSPELVEALERQEARLRLGAE